MQFGQWAWKSQSDTRSGGHFSVFSLVETDKRLEYFFPHLTRDNHSVIHCTDTEYIAFIPLGHLQRYVYIMFRIFHGIVQQVTDNLGECLLIDMSIKIRLGQLQGKFQSFLFGKRSKPQVGFFQHLRDVAFSKVQTESLTFRLAEV